MPLRQRDEGVKMETETEDGNGREDIFIGIGSVVAVVGAVVLAVCIWKSVCSQNAGRMKQYIVGSPADEYGATLELSAS